MNGITLLRLLFVRSGHSSWGCSLTLIALHHGVRLLLTSLVSFHQDTLSTTTIIIIVTDLPFLQHHTISLKAVNLTLFRNLSVSEIVSSVSMPITACLVITAELFHVDLCHRQCDDKVAAFLVLVDKLLLVLIFIYRQ